MKAVDEAWANRRIAAKALTAGSKQAQFGFGDSFESSPSK